MSAKDILLLPIYLLLIYATAMWYVNRKKHYPIQLKKTFMKGLHLKLIGGIAFALIYTYYYGGGDTYGFYHWSGQLDKYFVTHPAEAFRFMTNTTQEVFNQFIWSSQGGNYHYLMKYGTAEVFFVKISSVVNILGLNSFLSTTLLFAYFSYFGLWSLFLVFYDIRKDLLVPLSYGLLFVPSVFFWGSGIMKDTASLAALGFLTNAIYFGLIKRQKLVKNTLIILISAFVIAKLKGYILLAFIPPAGFWIFMSFKDRIKNSLLRVVSMPVLLLMGAVFAYFLIGRVGDELGKFSLGNLQQTAEGYQSWHTTASEHGSGYTLGTVGDYSTFSLVRLAPKAINITFFRPYLWEADGVVVLFAAFESLGFFLLFIYILVKKNVKLPYLIGKDSTAAFCLMFALVLGMAVGLTSFNFGALVRYKIPCIPFFSAALIFLLYDKPRTVTATANRKKKPTKLALSNAQ